MTESAKWNRIMMYGMTITALVFTIVWCSYCCCKNGEAGCTFFNMIALGGHYWA